MEQDPLKIRKSEFRKYYMISQNYAYALVKLGTVKPSALKVLLYFLNNMNAVNEVVGGDYKNIKKAYEFIKDGDKRCKSISSSTFYQAVKDLDQYNIIDTNYIKYKKENSGSQGQQELEKYNERINGKLGTVNMYVLNPDLVWNSDIVSKLNCLFPKKKKSKAMFYNLESQEKSEKLKQNEVNQHEIEQNEAEKLRYYMVNKNYANDIYWLAQQDMNAIIVLFYLFQVMNYLNAVTNRKLCNYKTICSKCKMSRQAASKAIGLLSRHNFIYIEKKGQFNTYIVNPEVAWSSEKNNLSKCEFPKNLSIKTPFLRQRPDYVQQEKKGEKINFRLLARNFTDAIAREHPQLTEHWTETDIIRNRRKITEELQLLSDNYEHVLLIELLKGIIEDGGKEEEA